MAIMTESLHKSVYRIGYLTFVLKVFTGEVDIGPRVMTFSIFQSLFHSLAYLLRGLSFHQWASAAIDNQSLGDSFRRGLKPYHIAA